jgi:hypothetical protein
MALTLSTGGQGGVFTLRGGSFEGRFQASVTPPASATLLLDAYPGAAAAYSLRKLRTAYTGNCIQVRRSSDGALLDIGFVNNVLDTATLQSFIGVNTGVLSIWYDQSGNGNNAIPVSINNAPIIIQSGVLVTDVGKVALQVDVLGMDISGITVNSSYAGFSVMSRTSSTGFLASFCASSTVQPVISFAYNDGFLYNENSVNFIKYAFNLTGRFLFTTTNVSTNQTAYRNATLQATTPTALAGANVLSRILARTAPEGVVGKSQEHIFYNTNQASNRTAIETNINSYYSIY